MSENKDLIIEKKLKLNDRQRMFCLEYQKDMNATQAAIRAGYSKDSAGQQAGYLMKNTSVRAYIARQAERRIAAAEVDSDYLVEKARLIAERCTDHETWDAANGLRGVELLAKLKSLGDGLEDRAQVQVNVNMTSEEVTRIYTEYMTG